MLKTKKKIHNKNIENTKVLQHISFFFFLFFLFLIPVSIKIFTPISLCALIFCFFKMKEIDNSNIQNKKLEWFYKKIFYILGVNIKGSGYIYILISLISLITVFFLCFESFTYDMNFLRFLPVNFFIFIILFSLGVLNIKLINKTYKFPWTIKQEKQIEETRLKAKKEEEEREKKWAFDTFNNDQRKMDLKILGLNYKDNHSHIIIKKQWFKIAKQYHPDLNKNPDALEKFTRGQAAYRRLIRK